MKFSVVIPVKNDWVSLEMVLSDLDQVSSSICTLLDVIIVNDGSETVPQLSKRNFRQTLISLDGHVGMHVAIRCGVAHLNTGPVLILPADGQADLTQLLGLINEYRGGTEIVSMNWAPPFWRAPIRFLVKSCVLFYYSLIYQRTLYGPYLNSKYLVLSPSVVAFINSYGKQDMTVDELLWRCDVSKKQLTQPFKKRAQGRSKWRFIDKVSLVLHVLGPRSKKGVAIREVLANAVITGF